MADKFLVSRPAGNRIMNLADDDLRENARTLKALLEVEHSPLDGSDEVDGKHKYVTLAEQGSDILNVADRVAVYAKEVATITELFARDSAGGVTQLTSGGINSPVDALYRHAAATLAQRFMLATLRMTNNIAIVARNGADDDDLNLMVLDASDILHIGDSDAGDVQKLHLMVASDATDPEQQLLYEYGSGDKKIFHEGHMGVGSLLDADLLDGAEGIAFMKKAGDFLHTFTSITADTVVQAHGLSATPTQVSWYLEKKTGGAESGWVIGERVFGEGYNPRLNTDDSGGNPGVLIGADATNVFYMHAGKIRIFDRPGGSLMTINKSNWELVVRVWV